MIILMMIIFKIILEPRAFSAKFDFKIKLFMVFHTNVLSYGLIPGCLIQEQPDINFLGNFWEIIAAGIFQDTGTCCCEEFWVFQVGKKSRQFCHLFGPPITNPVLHFITELDPKGRCQLAEILYQELKYLG